MDIASPEFLSGLVTVGVVIVTAILGTLLVRRARAVRRRQIDASDDSGTPDLAPAPEAFGDSDDDLPRVPATRVPAKSARILPFPVTPAPITIDPPDASDTDAPVIPIDQPVAPDRRSKEDLAGLKTGLARTRSGWVSRLGQLFSGKRQIDPTLVDEIEKVLLTADIGVRTSQKLLEEIRSSLSKNELRDSDAIWEFLRRRCTEILSLGAEKIDISRERPFVILIIGVNGSGKTTTIGKLAAKFKKEGRSVLLGAGDTFRAAAVEQLEVWGQRADVPVVRGKEGADPSSVLFDAVKKGKADGVDLVIGDTAGRLHTKNELMEELQKVRRVIAKAHETAPHETWLVVDSTMGQNAISQAKVFTEAMKVTGIVLTKLDGTAKGGVILGIADQLGIPVRYIGVGERVEDLREFDAEQFVEALFEVDDVAAAAP